ncbi:MAG: phospholipid carrier-dependent glycosyltransferase [Sideroxyarcus sp.]|nr:phospholipid carrier-dependent glycosyltransferase [Sideroxyarcus sp.]
MLRRIAAMRSFWYLAAMLLAVLVYFYGLDSQHIPRNGDEDVYAHITRLTAQSGHLLPLQSALDNMRNTKPPLLFWQGIVATNWGQEWDWWHLRYPSVLYTLLTALLLFLLGKKITGQVETGCVAALTFLSFFSTYRYGRPFLVNPAEVFWFFLPFFTLLYWRPFSFESRLWIPLLLGAEIGIGLLYKSFALLAPIGLALAWWYLHQRRYQWRECSLKDAAKPILTGIVALSLFALWFVFDPDPQAVWREFVMGENAGKFAAHGDGYWGQLVWGGSSVWALLLGYPMNAGLLAFPVAALFVVAYRRRFRLSDEEKLLWIWMAALFIVFAIPSQRSARYLLEAMPGVALLCALNWQRIPRWVFVAALIASGAVLALLALLAMSLQNEVGGLYGWGYWLLMGATVMLLLLAVFKAAWTRGLANAAALLTLLGLAAFLRPFDGALGTYSAEARHYVQGKDVWVSCNFRAHDEGHRIMLKGAQVHGYDENRNLSPDELASRYPLFTLQLPLQAEVCQGCKVIGQRLEIRGRHSNDELRAMLGGDVYRHLFVKEVLLEAPTGTTRSSKMDEEGCR